MLVKIETFERDVRTALNANCHDQPLAYDPSQLSLSQIIRLYAAESVDEAHRQAPLEWLEQGHTFGDSLCWDSTGRSGYVPLPADFLRLVAFQMSDWDYAVTAPLVPDTPEYRLQRSPWHGLRGNPERPVCALVNRPEGVALEFYACHNATATVVRAQYIPIAAIDSGDCIDISPRCYSSALDICIKKIKKTYG